VGKEMLNTNAMVSRTSLLFRLLFYVMSLCVLGYSPGTSWRNFYAIAALKEDGTVEA
tara:strand:- start:221 stop:391 length:171 start_codon:yes stop_codon:yes gene_type:complete